METGHKKGHYFNKIPDDIISNHTRFSSFIKFNHNQIVYHKNKDIISKVYKMLFPKPKQNFQYDPKTRQVLK